MNKLICFAAVLLATACKPINSETRIDIKYCVDTCLMKFTKNDATGFLGGAHTSLANNEFNQVLAYCQGFYTSCCEFFGGIDPRECKNKEGEGE